MKPKPPICIKIAIISFPKTLQCSAVFTTIRPVTAVAELAVNKASRKDVLYELTVEIGNNKKKVPRNIIIIYPKIINWPGESCLLLI